MILFVGLVLGAALGAVGVLLVMQRRLAEAAREAALDRQRAETAEQRVDEARERHAREADEVRERHAAELASAREREQEKLKLLEQTREQLQKDLQAISSRTLQAASKQLIELTNEQRKADSAAAEKELAKRSGEIKLVVEPIAKHLEKVERQIGELERERKGTQGKMDQLFESMRGQVEQLRGETGQLVTALRKPQVRGSWGEMQLRNCVEAANMTPYVDFEDQKSVAGDDGGTLRPDMVVRMPGGGIVVVDSKVPLDAYLNAIELPDGSERDEQLRRHARQLRTHLDQLSSKRYHAQFDRSPAFVVCFIPNEAIFSAAMTVDRSLLEHGADKGVLLTTPASLMALLYTAARGWSQEQIAAEARAIGDLARELHKRAATFLEPLEKLGRHLGRTVDAYNTAVGSVESRLLPQLRKIEDAGAGSEKELAAPTPIDRTTRHLDVPELEAGRAVAGLDAGLPEALELDAAGGDGLDADATDDDGFDADAAGGDGFDADAADGDGLDLDAADHEALDLDEADGAPRVLDGRARL